MIDVGKFAKPMINEEKGTLRFGTEAKENISAELRKFADRVEKGEILIQKVQSGTVVGIGDYTMQALFLEFAEYEPNPNPNPNPNPALADPSETKLIEDYSKTEAHGDSEIIEKIKDMYDEMEEAARGFGR